MSTSALFAVRWVASGAVSHRAEEADDTSCSEVPQQTAGPESADQSELTRMKRRIQASPSLGSGSVPVHHTSWQPACTAVSGPPLACGGMPGFAQVLSQPSAVSSWRSQADTFQGQAGADCCWCTSTGSCAPTLRVSGAASSIMAMDTFSLPQPMPAHQTHHAHPASLVASVQ